MGGWGDVRWGYSGGRWVDGEGTGGVVESDAPGLVLAHEVLAEA